jgi:hypothetical protein
LLDGLELEFVGKTTSTWPPERVLGLLSPATRQALRDVTFETELDQHEALERLSRSGSLVVMPSLQDNSPNAVYECLEHEIPFVATHVGGVPELIAPEDHARVLVQPDAASLEAVLRKVLSTAVVPAPARAAVSGGEALERWSGVIGLEAARPTGVSARADAADFVLVSGPDVVPDPELLDVLIQTQARTGADVVSCGVRVRTDGAETPSFFSGDAGGLGALDNVYGTVALIREALLDAPPASPSEPEADVMWPLLARLAAKGARIVSVPVPLATTDRRPGSVETDPGAALLVAQELEHALPDPLRTTGRLVAGLASPR